MKTKSKMAGKQEILARPALSKIPTNQRPRAFIKVKINSLKKSLKSLGEKRNVLNVKGKAMFIGPVPRETLTVSLLELLMLKLQKRKATVKDPHFLMLGEK